MASARFHRPEENNQSEPSWSLAVSEQLSITRELRSNGQTRQRWSNINQYSVTVMPISHLKCFQKHLVVYCLAVKWESLWPGSHVEISWGNTKHRPPAGAQPIGTNALSEMTCIGQSLPSRARFFKAWKQSHEEVQKSSYLSEHLNYNIADRGYWHAFFGMMPINISLLQVDTVIGTKWGHGLDFWKPEVHGAHEGLVQKVGFIHAHKHLISNYA